MPCAPATLVSSCMASAHMTFELDQHSESLGSTQMLVYMLWPQFVLSGPCVSVSGGWCTQLLTASFCYHRVTIQWYSGQITELTHLNPEGLHHSPQ